jgi:hypothetical protein
MLFESPYSAPIVTFAVRTFQDEDEQALSHYISYFADKDGYLTTRSRAVLRFVNGSANGLNIGGKTLRAIPGLVQKYADGEIPTLTKLQAEVLAATLSRLAVDWRAGKSVADIANSADDAVGNVIDKLDKAGFHSIASNIDKQEFMETALFANGHGNTHLRAKAHAAWDSITLVDGDIVSVVTKVNKWGRKQRMPFSDDDARRTGAFDPAMVSLKPTESDRLRTLEAENAVLKARAAKSTPSKAAEEKHTPIKANVLNVSAPSKNAEKNQNSLPDIGCFNCGRDGHLAINCAKPCKCGADHFANECTNSKAASNTTTGAKTPGAGLRLNR